MLTNKKIMIQKESAIRIIECFNRLGQDYYSNLYSEEDIEYARQRLIERGLTESEAESFPYEKDESNPFNSRHDAKVFIKWLQKYFGITVLPEVILNNKSLDQLAETLSENIERDDMTILHKIILLYGYAYDNVASENCAEEIEETLSDYFDDYIDDGEDKISQTAEEIFSTVRNRMKML